MTGSWVFSFSWVRARLGLRFTTGLWESLVSVGDTAFSGDSVFLGDWERRGGRLVLVGRPGTLRSFSFRPPFSCGCGMSRMFLASVFCS